MQKKFLSFAIISCIIFSFGCTSVYVGKNRQEIVEIIAQEQQKSPEAVYIYVPRRHNYRFNDPSEILDKNRGWGPDMRTFDQWGILPYKKFLYDGTFCTLLTFKNDIVTKEEEIHSGGHVFFKPLGFLFLLFALPFAH